MFVAVAIAFPALLLLAILGMERVERPLHQWHVRKEVERLLASDAMTHPELEKFVADGYRVVLKRYWRHRDSGAIERSRTRRTTPNMTTAVAPLAVNQTEGGTHVAGA